MNNFYNPYNNYSNNYFGRPQNSSIQQTQFFTPLNNIQFANLDEAKSYVLPPNSQMIFLDKDKQRCYLKTSDNNGYSKFEIYNLQKQDGEIQEASAESVAPDLSVYAKNESVDALKNELDAFKADITNSIKEVYKKIELKSALENISDSRNKEQ